MSVLPDFLEDAIDLHVHSAPDVDVRRFNDLDLAREAERAGMGAILIKSHQNSTVERAFLVSKVVTGIQVFGGLVLNETVGGLNVAAVKLALAMGAKEIWMPTRSALNHRSYHGESGGITVLDAGGSLVPAGGSQSLANSLDGLCSVQGTGRSQKMKQLRIVNDLGALGVGEPFLHGLKRAVVGAVCQSASASFLLQSERRLRHANSAHTSRRSLHRMSQTLE